MLILHPSSSCDLCTEAYGTDSSVGGRNAPYALPCGHSLCQTCMNSLVRHICPFCRAGFDPLGIKKLVFETSSVTLAMGGNASAKAPERRSEEEVKRTNEEHRSPLMRDADRHEPEERPHGRHGHHTQDYTRRRAAQTPQFNSIAGVRAPQMARPTVTIIDHDGQHARRGFGNTSPNLPRQNPFGWQHHLTSPTSPANRTQNSSDPPPNPVHSYPFGWRRHVSPSSASEVRSTGSPNVSRQRPFGLPVASLPHGVSSPVTRSQIRQQGLGQDRTLPSVVHHAHPLSSMLAATTVLASLDDFIAQMDEAFERMPDFDRTLDGYQFSQ